MPSIKSCLGIFTVSLLAVMSAMAVPVLAASEVVNVYSYRQPVLIDPLFEAFRAKTGIEVKYVFAKKGLIERLAQEGRSSPADIVLTADAGRLVETSARGLTQAVTSQTILDNVPAALRDPDDQWFGLTMRARVLFVSNARVSKASFTYTDLANPRWKGRICMRSGSHPYNIGMIAAMIAHQGKEATKSWLTGLKANLARRPTGNERAQAKAVYSGECDIAIANTYYMGKMLTNEKDPEQKDWAAASKIVFPTWQDGKTHVNISGMAMTKHAPNKANALKLMEFLASPEAQTLYAEGNFEYPVAKGTEPSGLVRSWGSFTPDDLAIGKLHEFQREASTLVDEVRFDQ